MEALDDHTGRQDMKMGSVLLQERSKSNYNLSQNSTFKCRVNQIFELS
jgi:hypothetical protein